MHHWQHQHVHVFRCGHCHRHAAKQKERSIVNDRIALPPVPRWTIFASGLVLIIALVLAFFAGGFGKIDTSEAETNRIVAVNTQKRIDDEAKAKAIEDATKAETRKCSKEFDTGYDAGYYSRTFEPGTYSECYAVGFNKGKTDAAELRELANENMRLKDQLYMLQQANNHSGSITMCTPEQTYVPDGFYRVENNVLRLNGCFVIHDGYDNVPTFINIPFGLYETIDGDMMMFGTPSRSDSIYRFGGFVAHVGNNKPAPDGACMTYDQFIHFLQQFALKDRNDAMKAIVLC